MIDAKRPKIINIFFLTFTEHLHTAIVAHFEYQIIKAPQEINKKSKLGEVTTVSLMSSLTIVKGIAGAIKPSQKTRESLNLPEYASSKKFIEITN
jgi:hypothetical protein